MLRWGTKIVRSMASARKEGDVCHVHGDAERGIKEL